jgi:hypothetical protein
VIEGAVVADHRRFADHHAHAVIDEEAPADHGARMDLDPGEESRQIGDDAGEPLEIAFPQPVRQPMGQDGVQPRDRW